MDAATQALALEAVQRQQSRKRITVQQAKALDRVRAARDHDAKWAAFRSITAADWKALAASGGHTLSGKARNDQAVRHGIPFGGPVIDLAAVVAALHKVLDDKATSFILPTLEEVADHFAVHPDTVKSWRAEGMPGARHHWDLSAIARWLAHRRSVPTNVAGHNDTSRSEGERRKVVAEAARQELRLDRERHRVIDRAEHEKIIDGLLDAIATLCEQAGVELPRRLASVAKKDEAGVITAYFDGVLRHWSGANDDNENSEAHGASRETLPSRATCAHNAGDPPRRPPPDRPNGSRAEEPAGG